MLPTRLKCDRIAAAMALLAVVAIAPPVPSRPARPVSLVLPAQAGCQVEGPFPTLRRASEVAAEVLRRGGSAVAYREGDGYYVRSC